MTKRKKLLIVITSVVVVVVLIATVIFVLKPSWLPQPLSGWADEVSNSFKAEPILTQEEQLMAISNGVSTGQMTDDDLEKILNNTESDEQKARYINEYVSYALLDEDSSDEQKKRLLDLSIEAYNLSGGIPSLWLIVDSANAAGDESTAVKYKAILDDKLAEVDSEEGQDSEE